MTVPDIALVHDDPHYGQSERTDRGSKGRSREAGGTGQGRDVNGRGRPKGRDFPAVIGDDRPFDPSPLLALQRPLVVWGGHLCQPALPPSPSWLFWDKREDSGSDDNGDGEMAWSNLGGPIRRFSHLWRGTCRASETGVLHLHGTQKPVALCTWVYQRARLKPGDLVFVPHGGSGPDLPACRAMGLRLVWCDVERWCCNVAIARLPDAPVEILRRASEHQRRHAVTAARAAEPVGPLFKGAA